MDVYTALARESHLPGFHPQRKSNRLRSNRDFQVVYKKGKFFSSPDLVLYALAKEYDERSRIGYSVSRSIGSKVKRNRVKRQMKEITRLNATLLPEYGFDFILLARQSASTKSYADLEAVYKTLSIRLDAWRSNSKTRGNSGVK